MANLELGSDISVDGGVELGESDGGSVFLQLGGSLGVLGSQLLAVSAPRSIELGEHELVVLHNLIEVVLKYEQKLHFAR